MLLPVFLLGVAAGSGAAQPQPRDDALTVHAAYRDGGSFTDVATDSRLRIETSGGRTLQSIQSFGLAPR